MRVLEDMRGYVVVREHKFSKELEIVEESLCLPAKNGGFEPVQKFMRFLLERGNIRSSTTWRDLEEAGFKIVPVKLVLVE